SSAPRPGPPRPSRARRRRGRPRGRISCSSRPPSAPQVSSVQPRSPRRALTHGGFAMKKTIGFLAGALALSLAHSSTPLFAAETPQPAPQGARFLILVRGGDRGNRTAEEQKAVVQEYVAWARSLRTDGHLVAADELAAKSRVLTPKKASAAERPASAG